MNNIIKNIYKNNAIVYKVLLFFITVISVVYLLPKGGQFKYDFNKGKPWQYDNLLAPFDFAIQKTEDEINLEKQNIEDNAKKYFEYKTSIPEEVKSIFKSNSPIWVLSLESSSHSLSVVSITNIVLSSRNFSFEI